MLLLSFVSKGQTVMASGTPKWCIARGIRREAVNNRYEMDSLILHNHVL